MLKKIAGSIGSVFGSGRKERELDEELAFHIEKETEENVRRGMPPEQARRAALVRFGGVAKTKDETREASHAVWLDTTLQDVRYGLRSLRRNPGYAAAAILTLALGIGANTAIFSVVHGVLLQSLPYGGGERLVRLRVDAPGAGIQDGRFSPLEITDLRQRTHTLEAVSEYHSMWFVLLGRTEPERVQTGVVSANPAERTAPAFAGDWARANVAVPVAIPERRRRTASRVRIEWRRVSATGSIPHCRSLLVSARLHRRTSRSRIGNTGSRSSPGTAISGKRTSRRPEIIAVRIHVPRGRKHVTFSRFQLARTG